MQHFGCLTFFSATAPGCNPEETKPRKVEVGEEAIARDW